LHFMGAAIYRVQAPALAAEKTGQSSFKRITL
jgi:hypothetical protein